MTETTQYVIEHGLLLLFLGVWAEQMGLPIPAFPWLLASGALVADGKMDSLSPIAAAVVASLLADGFWFYLGRYRGNRVLSLLCRISLEPDSCVRRTQGVFGKYGVGIIAVNKLIPGINTITPPLAGMTGVSLPLFLGLDAVASILYAAPLVGAGFLFHHQIERLIAAFQQAGLGLLGLVGVIAALYIGYKVWERNRLLRELRMTRISVEELRRKLQADEPVLILDVRPRKAIEQDDAIIPGAVHLELDHAESYEGRFDEDREIVVYCACPNEVSAARVTLLLQKRGVRRVRPLMGGITEWRRQKYPVDPVAALDSRPAGVTRPG